MTNATYIGAVVEDTCALLDRASGDLDTAASIIRAVQQGMTWESPAGAEAQRELDERVRAVLGAAVECQEVAAGLRLVAAGQDSG